MIVIEKRGLHLPKDEKKNWSWFRNKKSKDYCKADLKQRTGILFFITIFRLAIPAFYRFTDVTELM